MARKAIRPAALLRGPFTVDEARRAGLSRWHLEGASWSRLGPSLYVPAELRKDPLHILAAVCRRLPPGAAFSGLTSAWLHYIDVEPCSPVEVTVPPDCGISSRAGINVRRSQLLKGDVVMVRGFAATSALRTVGELSGRLSLVEAIVVADQALHGKLFRLDQLAEWARLHRGGRGVEQVRRVVELAEPASESPMESRLRMVLMLGGLPRPRAQVEIRDRWARLAGRVDLYYESARLGIEYDGAGHRANLADDNRRQNKLFNAGVHLLRFTAGDVFGNPESVVNQVRDALSKPATAGARVYRPRDFSATAGARG